MRLHRFKFKMSHPRLLALFLIAMFSNAGVLNASAATSDPNLACTDVKFVFARGSGVEVGSTRDYVPFVNAVTNQFSQGNLSFSFYELGSKAGGYSGRSYPAPGIGISTWKRFDTSLGALFSGGASGTYGDSVEEGSDEAMSFILLYRAKCPSSKIVLAGYSQGAQTVSRTLQKIKPAWITAAATFGDPKLYLPEGKRNLFSTSFGLSTKACTVGASSYSPYRTYVPDCYAYEGILGGYQPYQLSGYDGKLLAYCQFHDVICSSYIDIDNLAYGHATYDQQGTYARAAADLYDKVYYSSTSSRSPTYDVAILVDNSTDAADFLPVLKTYALRLANSTFRRGGRVALLSFGDPYATGLFEVCNFSTCSASNIEENLSWIASYGTSYASVLSGSYGTLTTLSWKAGASKSFVFLSPSLLSSGSAEREQLIEKSLEIDPVNFYALTTPASASSYAELAKRTDGAVFSPLDSTDYSALETAIFDHADAATFAYAETSRDNPVLKQLTFEKTSASSLRVSTVAEHTLYLAVAINDYILGYTDVSTFEITDLDLTLDQVVCLAPISPDGFRASPSCTTIPGGEVVVPKVPNSGKAH